MLRKIYLTLSLFCLSFYGFAQNGGLRGTVTDEKTKETIPFAAVVVYMNGSQAGQAQTDLDGNYVVKPLTPGKYDVKIVILGYAPKELKGVVVASDKTTYADIKLSTSAIELKEFTVEEYKVPLIAKDNTSAGNTATREDIAAAPTRDIAAVAATTAGVAQIDNGQSLNIRGSRSDATAYYIDGVKVQSGGGQLQLANAGVEQIEVITGGTPAQYGDVTGGVINITTRGPSKTFNGGIEVQSSQLTDAYGYNLVSGSLTGPLYTRRGETQPVLGFFLAGEFQHQKEPDPSASPRYKVKDEKLEFLRNNPIKFNPDGSLNFNSTYLTMNDLEEVKARPNVADWNAKVSGKVDFKPTTNTIFTVGGTFFYLNSHSAFASVQTGLLNSYSNPVYTQISPRVYLRFTQKFGNTAENKENKGASVIKNAYYTIQADYSGRFTKSENPEYGKDIFKYGYNGRFTTRRVDTTFSPFDTVMVKGYTTGLKYEPSGLHPEIDAYNKALFSRYQFDNESDLLLSGAGFPNGYDPNVFSQAGLYGLFGNTGTYQGTYRTSGFNQYRITASGSADIKRHTLTFGLEYEQIIDRGYAVGGSGLWGLMKTEVNRQFNGLNRDKSVATLVGTTPDGKNIYDYPYLIAPNQTFFDKKFRESRPELNSQSYIDIDSYAPSDFNLSMFSADELLNKGSGYVNYYGYDYQGNVVDSKQSFNSFFTDAEKRPIGAFKPNYIAAYIQDKFEFKDLLFRVGVRFDRYDANQKVLKDKYLLYETHTAGDNDVAALLAKNGQTRPSNIGDDFAVYGDNIKATQIVGYRSGDIFYDANGTRVLNSDALTQAGTIQPYLSRPEEYQNKTINPVVFQDYKPVINIMPRVAFSFPISDEALFYAHYDILTQRPSQGASQVHPEEYLYMTNFVNNGGQLTNPDLKMQKTIDYELGFKQKLTNSSALTLSAFYKELRDLSQIGWVVNAFPISYQTALNKDFGTVKGFTAVYDLRRTSNLRTLVSYTLQFADGTGSLLGSASNLRKNDPEIRTPLPVDYDYRHNIVVTLDYRYGMGEDYDGPLYKTFKVLEGMGLNVKANLISGGPYTRRGATYATQDVTARAAIPVLGGINGSRLPWIFRIDAKLDRNINLKIGRKGEDKRTTYLNVYVLVQNVLDTRNILSVYPYTGDPLNDGYLASADGQQKINSITPSKTSYVDLYNVKQSANSGYSIPRVIRLGVSFNF